MRKATTTLVLTTALLGWMPAAFAQDATKPAASSASTADSAEDAFLKAYFAEKELKDYAAAEKAYAAVIATDGASHEVLARSTLGRARCLAQLKRADESAALYAKVEKEFADVADVAKEAREARKSDVASTGAGFEAKLRDAIFGVGWENRAPQFGDRAVPALTAMLRDDAPDTVIRAATVLSEIDTPAAVDALTKAIDSGESPYPTQVIDGATSHWSGMRTLKRLASSRNEVVRAQSLGQLMGRNEVPDDVFASAATDAALCAKLLAADRVTNAKNCIRLLATALAAGGPSRDLALDRLRDERLGAYSGWASVIGGLGDPPASVLHDAEAMHAIVERIGNAPTSDAFAAACLAFPATERRGVWLTIDGGRKPPDPDRFVDAFVRTGLNADGLVMSAFAEGLAGALGDPPAPARVRRIGAVWPAVDAEWASDFVKELVHRDPTGAAALAFQDALTNADVRSYSLEALAKLTATNGEAWALPAFAKELTHPYHEVRSKAAWAMKRLQENRVDLTAFVPVLIASLDEEDAPNTSMLVALGAPAVKPLLDALRTSKAKWRVIGVLGQIGDKSAADEVERILRTSADGAEVRAAAEALVALRGNDAKDALAAALVNNGGANAHGVLRSCENSEQFSVQARVELVKIAFAKTPGRVYPDEDGAAEGLPADATREVALLALKSPSSEDRAWGAEQEQHLLDIDAWDALLAAAQDHDVRVRDAARDALRAIRAKESEMAEFRAMGEERATRLRIESLLRPKDGEGRSERVVRVRAGVAAIAATNLAGMVNDLIRLAAEDEDESVREDARKALLAMAKPAVPAPQPPAEKK